MTEHSKVYLIVADWCKDWFGPDVEVFMATMNFELAEEELERVKENHHDAEIVTMSIDKRESLYLGGYHE